MTVSENVDKGILIERITSFDQFRALKNEWDELSRDSVNTIFLSYLWLQEWWHVYGSDYQVWTLVARQDGLLVGILPLMLSRELFGIRRLMFMGIGEITPNHLDIIADPEERERVFQAFITFLGQAPIEWDVLELDKLPGDSLSLERFQNGFAAPGVQIKSEITAICPYIELPSSFEAYLMTRGSTTREGYRRARRKLEKEFPQARFSVARTPEEVERVMDSLVDLHQQRWLQKGHPGAFSNPDFIQFHRKVALIALQTNMLRLFYLQVDQKVVAVYYCYRIGDSIQFYLGGFDEQMSRFSPGILINGYAIEQSILEGARRFDFLEGEERYKQHWMTRSQDNITMWIFRPTWRGRIAASGLKFRNAIIFSARRLLSQEVRLSIRLVLLRLGISI